MKMAKEVFNRSYYDILLNEDRKMVDEYVSKMGISDINLFMKRLIARYEVEEAVEINEDRDEVVVFERHNAISKRTIKLPYLRIVSYFAEYFKNAGQKTKYIALAVDEYFKAACKNEKDWTPNKKAKNQIRKICLKLMRDDECIRKVDDVKLPMRFYTYRGNKKRIGIAIDKNTLTATIKAAAGYGRNYNMNDVVVKLDHKKKTDSDLIQFIKNACYWSPKNAIQHGFDDKTGIIWFDGKQVDENKWQFPNGVVVEENQQVRVSFICATDAFSKMFQRFDFNKRIQELTLQLESELVV
jgi:hypothetical protein